MRPPLALIFTVVGALGGACAETMRGSRLEKEALTHLGHVGAGAPGMAMPPRRATGRWQALRQSSELQTHETIIKPDINTELGTTVCFTNFNLGTPNCLIVLIK